LLVGVKAESNWRRTSHKANRCYLSDLFTLIQSKSILWLKRHSTYGMLYIDLSSCY